MKNYLINYGGSWISNNLACKSSDRLWSHQQYCCNYVGFRLIKTVKT